MKSRQRPSRFGPCATPLWIVTLAMLAAIGFAAPASAHFLSKHRAMQMAKKKAYEYADVGEYYGAANCRLVSAHVRRCVIWSYLEETPDTYGLYCDAYSKVRFVNRWSYRTTSRGWYRGACDDHVTNEETTSPPPAAEWKWIWNGPLTQWPQIVF
jgi:hypothetical protein